MFIPFNLQFFADAGTNVNATTVMQNAYDASSYDARTSANAMAPELKAFYDTELLENARMKMVYAQFGKKQPLPKGHNGTVEWRKWNTFARAGQLQEAVIPTGQTFGVTKIDGAVNQYGTYTAISDVLELQSYDDIILGATEEMGASAAETQEVLIRNALLTNTNVLYCDNINRSTGAVISTPNNTHDYTTSGKVAMAADDTYGWSLLTPTMINKAVTIMKKNKAPMINGRYVMVCHPSVLFELRENKDWIEAHKYAATTQIFNGEVGELHGVRFIEDPDAPVLGYLDSSNQYQNREYATSGSTVTNQGATYASYMFGKDAFGIIDPEGGGLEMIIKGKGEVGGPLEQFSTIGYKFMTNGATMLYPERMLRVMSCSIFSATDEPNY